MYTTFTTHGTTDITSRERQVLHLVGMGYTDKEIGRILAVSARTINGHVKNIFVKLGAKNRMHALALAMDRGILS